MITIPDQQLSKYFKLSDLTVSKSFPDIDNTPSVMFMDNLKNLAVFLDTIYDNFGPFEVTSGYRSPELNAAISSVATPSTTSYHMQGIAADLAPVNDDAYSYFLKILRSPDFFGPNGIIGELGNEAAAHGIVHISMVTPTKKGKAFYLSGNTNRGYTDQQVADLINPPSTDTEQTYYNPTPATDNSDIVEADVFEDPPKLLPITQLVVGLTLCIFFYAAITWYQKRKA